MRKIMILVTLAAAPTVAASAEEYRLVHAIGNTEHVVEKGLTKAQCEGLKKERIAIAEAMRIHSEKLGIGSITCLPESFFLD